MKRKKAGAKRSMESMRREDTTMIMISLRTNIAKVEFERMQTRIFSQSG